jgi:hypothetical protein
LASSRTATSAQLPVSWQAVAQAVDKDGVYKVTRGLIAACMKARGYPVGN